MAQRKMAWLLVVTGLTWLSGAVGCGGEVKPSMEQLPPGGDAGGGGGRGGDVGGGGSKDGVLPDGGAGEGGGGGGTGSDQASQPELCEVECQGRECGDDGCGGSCGKCGEGQSCLDGSCVLSCDSAACKLGMECFFGDGTAALCGGTITFNEGLQGQPLPVNLSVEELFKEAGVVFSTGGSNSTVATNSYQLKSPSGGNSCASLDKWGTPWQEAVRVRFVKPTPGALFQGATHYVSLYIGKTWPQGIAVEFYEPTATPGPSGQPFHTLYTDSQDTDFVEYPSGTPIGSVVVRKAEDPDFTIDDLSFGPVYVP